MQPSGGEGEGGRGGQPRGTPPTSNRQQAKEFLLFVAVIVVLLLLLLFVSLRAFSAKAFANLHLNWLLSPWAAAASWRRQ